MILGISSYAFSNTLFNPDAVVVTSSLSSIESAVGPTIKVSSTVGIINVPFVVPVGNGNIIWCAKFFYFLFKIYSSPFLGIIFIFESLSTILAISSEYNPAQFITTLDLYYLFYVFTIY